MSLSSAKQVPRIFYVNKKVVNLTSEIWHLWFYRDFKQRKAGFDKEEGSMIFKKRALLPFIFCVPKTTVGMIYALDKIECIDRLFVVCVL